MRIVLFNVGFSPNLGDGLLSECLERRLERVVPGATVVRLDLAGRTAYRPGNANRGRALSLLARLPRFLRHAIARRLIGRIVSRLVTERWRPELARAQAVVIGGGNLFADSDLNFPLKLGAACREAAQLDLPVAVYAVGVSSHWSGAGQALFKAATRAARLVAVSVRDERSAGNWNRSLPGIPPGGVEIVRDPGLLAVDCYPVVRPASATGKRIGIGITSPVALRYHADETLARDRDFDPWFHDLVHRLVADGYDVLLFTNGSPEDEAHLDRFVAAGSQQQAPAALRVPRFADPGALAAFVSGLDCLCAHRLHACIAAYSYGVPHIGFTWDSKLRSFFTSVGRPEFVCDAVLTPVTHVLERIRDAIQQGIEPRQRLAVLDEARHGVDRLGQALLETCRA